jgi:chemotaxis protein CheX
MNNISTKEDLEKTCSVFIESVNNYFQQLTENPSETGVPFIKSQEDVLLRDFTGMIGISGDRKGFIYISGSRKLYEELINKFIGLDHPTNEDILDMAGELSNVVAGNMRETYGANFMISVPIVFEGRPQKLKFPKDVSVFVIPIIWANHEANVVIGLE